MISRLMTNDFLKLLIAYEKYPSHRNSFEACSIEAIIKSSYPLLTKGLLQCVFDV